MISTYNLKFIDSSNLLENQNIDLILTDLQYNIEYNNDKQLNILLEQFYKLSNNIVIVFCNFSQLSLISNYFNTKKGVTRTLVWEKTNPSPLNGQHAYINSIELAIWFKKQGSKSFNGMYKSNIFQFPNGSSEYHINEKNYDLLKELILDNSNEYETILDPFMSVGTVGIMARKLNRNFIGFESNKDFFEIACKRIDTFKRNIFDILNEDEEDTTIFNINEGGK